MYEPVFTQAIHAQPEQRYSFSWANEMPETALVKKRLQNMSNWREGKVLQALRALELAAAEVARKWPEDSMGLRKTMAGPRGEEHAIAVATAAVNGLVDSQSNKPPAELRLGTPEGGSLARS